MRLIININIFLVGMKLHEQDLSLIAYCKENFSLSEYNDDSSASTLGDVLKAHKANLSH